MPQPSLLDQVAAESNATPTAQATPAPTDGTPSASAATPSFAAAAPTLPTSTSGSLLDSVASESAATTPQSGSDTAHDLTVAEYAALPKDKQKEYDEHIRAGRSVFDPAIGFVKGLGESINTLSGLVSRVSPSLVRPQDVNAVRAATTATPGTLQPVGKVGESIAEFFLGDEALKGLSIAERLGLASKVAKLAESNPIIARIVGHGLTAVRGGTVTTAQQLEHGTTPGEALTTGAEATALGAGAGAVTEAVTPAVSRIFDSTTGEAESVPEPGFVKQVVEGKNVNQPGAQIAVRSGVRASTEAAGTADEAMAAHIENQPLLSGNQTVVDKPLSALKTQEQAAYDKMDEIAEFDVKAEKAQLANDKYKLQQLGNTDADITQRGNLIDSINDSESRITEAEQKMKAANIDPRTADAIHQQRMAGQDFKKVLVKNTNPDGSVNVDGLLKDSKNLRFNKYGDRLGQFMGNDAAETYMSELQEMQKLGAHAVKARWIAGILGTLALGGSTVAKIAHIGAALVP
jgi:hypothetical protein